MAGQQYPVIFLLKWSFVYCFWNDKETGSKKIPASLSYSGNPFIQLHHSLLLNHISIIRKTLAYALIFDEQMSVKKSLHEKQSHYENNF